MMFIGAKSTAKTFAGVGLLFCAILFLSIRTTNLAEARYLPTRADETDIEVLKDLIKGVLAEATMEQIESRLGRIQSATGIGDRYYQARAISQQIPIHRERRSMEMPLASEGDSLLRTTFGYDTKNIAKRASAS